MEPPRNDLDFTRALRELRPSPRSEFAAELDARLAAGFPPRGAGRRSAIQHIVERLRAIPPRRLLLPAGACALVAIAIATAVIATTEDEPQRTLLSAPARNGGDERLSFRSGRLPQILRANEARLAHKAPQAKAFSAPLAGAESSNHDGSGRYSKGYNNSYSGGVDRNAGNVAKSAVGTASAPASGVVLGSEADLPQLRSGPIAAQARHRKIERAALLVLATEADEVRAAASRVFATVHTYNGVVLNSSIRDGKEGEAGASFDLLVPSGKLSDALAAFTAIGEVRTRQESTQDITAPTVGLGERLRDAHARVESLLTQLSEAGSDAERAAAEARLRAERRHVASLRSRLSSLQRRASFSRVSLRIESGEAATAGDGDGHWGIGDALDDAAHILAIAAGVTLIGLAILTPLALICLLVWLARRAWVRRARARALD
jgi:hypothetical protein